MDYLWAYTKEFHLESRLNLQCKVTKVSRDPSGGHRIWYVKRLSDRPGWETGEHILRLGSN